MTRFKTSFVVLFACLLPPGNLRAQATPAADGQAVFRSTTSMVALNVTVTDGRRFVSGLTAADFEVAEDGVRQQVRFFESSNVPLDVILLLDTSASMRDRMPVVHDAARGFMRVLRPGDRGAVVTFSDQVRVIQELTADAGAIESAIGTAAADGGTALHNAIYVALKQFGRSARASGDVRRQAIAVLSDGQDTSSLVSFDDVVAQARSTGVNIYTIGLRSAEEPGRQTDRGRFSQADYAMKTLATETGAAAFFPTSIRDLKGAYQAIADELGAQYSIAYAPSDTRADGRYRRIAVRVISNPALRSRARAGYTASAGRGNADLPFPR